MWNVEENSDVVVILGGLLLVERSRQVHGEVYSVL